MDNNALMIPKVEIPGRDVEYYLSADATMVYSLNDYEQRRITINDEIDLSVIDNAVYHILRYNREDKGKKIEDRKPILLYLNTPGGMECAGISLIDTILISETPVYTVNLGICFSMGFLIFLAGKKRYSLARSQFLMHDGQMAVYDSAAKMKDRIEFESQLEAFTKGYVTSRTKIDDKKYDEKYRVEWYMLPDEAKKFGVVTDIVGIDCGIDDIL